MAVFPAFFGLLLVSFVKGNTDSSRDKISGQTVEITPREAVRRIGDDLIVLCKVPYPIDSCRMTVGSTPYRLIPSNQDEQVVYAGQGLQVGECGAHIKHIKEEWNGNISCMLPPQSGSIELTATMSLVVAKPPSNPQLLSPPQSNFKEGEILNAQCVVPNGRPAARITWYLDEDQLLSGVHQPVVTREGGMDTISQNVTLEISAEHNGRRLACRAEHEALDAPKEVARQLLVYYPPKRLEAGQITIFGLKIGAEGRLNVTVRANPPPRAQWTVGELVLNAPQTNEDTSITALEPVHLGNGYYNVTLVLTSVAKEDVDRTYYLRVSNDLGHEEFSLRLSTMDEPAGVELSPGAIAGIVIAILLIVIAVSLAVFAKATDRWCFGARDGEGGDQGKSSGESSDTESAVGRQRSRLSALSARVRAVLPRARDRVQATANIEADPENVAEEKKGVVYAELALGDQTAEKPPPPSTEYAEIVYTDQPAQVKENKE